MNGVRDGLASNPALPPPLVDRLIVVADPVQSTDLARRADLEPHHVRALLAKDDSAVTCALLEKGWVAPADVPTSNPLVALVVTAHPDADPDLARRLSSHPDARFWLPEQAHHLPADVVERLACDEDDQVVAQLVRFHALPAPLADELSRHPSPEVRKALAASPHTPPRTLARLMDFARELASNPATPPPIAAGLVHHHDARYWLAARTDLPPHVYEELAAEVEPGILTQLAANPAVPVEVLRQLTGTPALLRNPALPLDLVVHMAGAARIGLLPRVASASEEELRTLAGATAPARMLVACREDLPLDLFQDLVLDPGVAQAIVTNPLVTVDQLTQLVERHGPPLYARAALNPLCPPELLHHMASRASSEETYRAIARHPRTSGETLLLCLGDAQARYAAASHPNLPVETIVALLWSEFTASAAAANPSLPVHVMEALLSSTT
ncbi:hypothetical protein ACFOWZ_35860 [Lentzea rhizosphaerae]|uniref:Leucine rich repeat variant n=1 Tax=Lentzea rhizosphaerae TaxID=2041025 RepID=A0ABV8C4G1_9PSEU